MRPIPADLQAKLNSGVTTLCRCWRMVRRDGVALGFTDHDEDVTLDGLVCRAGTGLSGSEATRGSACRSRARRFPAHWTARC
jgi:hypothetical protein